MNKASFKRFATIAVVALMAVAVANRVPQTRRLING